MPGRIHAEPDLLIDELITHIADLLDEVMALTPVERLSGVDLASLRTEPPDQRGGRQGDRELESEAPGLALVVNAGR